MSDSATFVLLIDLGLPPSPNLPARSEIHHWLIICAKINRDKALYFNFCILIFFSMYDLEEEKNARIGRNLSPSKGTRGRCEVFTPGYMSWKRTFPTYLLQPAPDFPTYILGAHRSLACEVFSNRDGNRLGSSCVGSAWLARPARSGPRTTRNTLCRCRHRRYSATSFSRSKAASLSRQDRDDVPSLKMALRVVVDVRILSLIVIVVTSMSDWHDGYV